VTDISVAWLADTAHAHLINLCDLGYLEAGQLCTEQPAELNITGSTVGWERARPHRLQWTYITVSISRQLADSVVQWRETGGRDQSTSIRIHPAARQSAGGGDSTDDQPAHQAPRATQPPATTGGDAQRAVLPPATAGRFRGATSNQRGHGGGLPGCRHVPSASGDEMRTYKKHDHAHYAYDSADQLVKFIKCRLALN